MQKSTPGGATCRVYHQSFAGYFEPEGLGDDDVYDMEDEEEEE